MYVGNEIEDKKRADILQTYYILEYFYFVDHCLEGVVNKIKEECII